MAVLRDRSEPVPQRDLAGVWRDDPAQWRRCLDGLITDGLAEVAAVDADGDPLIALPA